MKKLIIAVLIAVLIPVIALADVDLGSMKFDDLIALQKKIVAEIMSRPEWKEVTVPGGRWVVGEDIPAGTYSIMPTKMGGYVRIQSPDGKLIISQGIRKEENSIGKIELLAGYIVEVENGSVIFAPPKGLGF